MKAQRLTALLAVLVGLAVLAFVLAGVPQTGDAPPGAATTATETATGPGGAAAGPATMAAGPAVTNPSGLPEVKVAELPAEARQTLSLIASGGPYPYARDNIAFGNFERILPRKPAGYYKEYTVGTPGESDRGARRIVAGRDGEKYYTPDHYNSFTFISESK
ncbi:ribonuclease domain-containing protein [Arthrobacter sp. AL08]|uniref:ribonuclease domain-containing protein n=1 Tax=unclassified Arthrobacter TaxID=235627 RepID=UPI00249A1B58|nr:MULTISPECIES: ribonuclease domain-containing protein [unclassified Arthrobacter]MDI3242806.1 ribonuclease domain-containing protein [Arthrobacter sp. AL05]MDI3278817.1 ribonuclease domain-containing protein [Arthrobacter sp. AL08]